MLEGLKSTALLFTKKKLIAPISGFSNEILCIFAAQGIVNLGVKNENSRLAWAHKFAFDYSIIFVCL